MHSIEKIGVVAILLLWASPPLTAQGGLPEGSQTTIFDMNSRIADIDSSLLVNHYSLAQRKALLKQLYQVDQRYRDSIENGSRSVDKQQLFSHKMMANDQANQVILGKLVKAFGWPTQQTYGEQGPLTAWLIVWHAKPDYQKRYYPLMKRAYQQGLIKQSPTQLGERLKHFSR